MGNNSENRLNVKAGEVKCYYLETIQITKEYAHIYHKYIVL